MFPLLPLFTLIFILNSKFVTSSTYPDSCDSLSYCSNGIPIDYPFSYHQNTSFCGYPGFAADCSAEGKVVTYISNNVYYVLNLDTAARMLTVVNKYILENECPRPVHNLTNTSPFLLFNVSRAFMTIFYNCSAYPPDEMHISCLEFNNTKRSYAFLRDVPFPQFDWYGNCEENVVVPLTRLEQYNDIFNDSNYKTALQLGFQLYWSIPTNCLDCERLSQGKCWTNTLANQSGCYCRQQEDGNCLQGPNPSSNLNFKVIISIVIAVAAAVGVIILVLFLVYKRSLFSLQKPISLWMIKIRNPTNVEVFLQNYECVALQRYSYADVKKMTNSFRDTLGQGGYGSVFKGCLADGQLVAVKVLKETKGNGDEFINEVATIGRTNHVNVVSLLGYSSHGSKRALIYEFMPNGSLERFIYNKNNSSTTGEHLGWGKLYQIALGIARGLDYLHRGCKMRILHFDIKPHNILLDEDFCPKISDFGLAKLCPTRESVVSMLAARGTIGYIAPEVYCRNFGSVSYKSDVYSYGMVVLEIVGGRKNIDATVENTSEIYFPNWIYNQLEKDISFGGSEEIFTEETRKKMVLVGLWCIQTHPTNRPSMTKVVEMLEGSIEDLEMPPNPFIDPPPTPFIDLPPTSSTAAP